MGLYALAAEGCLNYADRMNRRSFIKRLALSVGSAALGLSMLRAAKEKPEPKYDPNFYAGEVSWHTEPLANKGYYQATWAVGVRPVNPNAKVSFIVASS